MSRVTTVTGISFVTALGLSSAAADYPERPVRVIVPSAPGGVPDVNTRVVAAQLSQQMGKQFVVDNRPGGNGLIGFEIITRAPPDGYTIGYGTSSTLAISHSVVKDWPYQAGRDYQPIILSTATPFVLAVAAPLPVKSVSDLIALARKTPGKLLIAALGHGSGQHLAGALFQQMTATHMPLIQYKGTQQGLTDMIGGQVHLTFDGGPALGPHLRAGRVRGIAVTTARRSAFFPELPTIAEAGVPGYDVTPFGGFIAPGGVSRTILDRLNAEANKALASATVIEKFGVLGADIVGGTPEGFAAVIKRESGKWAAVVKEAGIKPQ